MNFENRLSRTVNLALSAEWSPHSRERGAMVFTCRMQGHFRTPTSRRFDRNCPPFSPSHIALTIPHSPPTPPWVVFYQGHRGGRRATSLEIGAATERYIVG